MLEIININPPNNSTSNYTDTDIEIEFNKEVSDSSLESINFQLYEKINDIDQLQAVTILKDIDNSNKIILRPTLGLSQNSKYMVFVRGDRNQNDAIKQGILSIDADVMDGNYIITFDTGVDVKPKIVTNVIEPPTVQTNETTDTVLDIIKVTPNVLFNIKQIGDFVIEFDKDIIINDSVVTTDGFNIDSDSEYTELKTAEIKIDQNNNKKLIVQFNGIKYEDGKIIEQQYVSGEKSNLPPNQKYRLTIHRDRIKTTDDSYLSDDIEIEMSSYFFPKYGNAYELRTESIGLIGDQYTDEEIEETLRFYSKKILDKLNIYYNECEGIMPKFEDKNLLNAIKSYVICNSIYTMARNVRKGGLTGITMKRLGDFQIDADQDSENSFNRNKILNDFKECASDAYDVLMALTNNNIRSSVKSINTTFYPHRNRSNGLWARNN